VSEQPFILNLHGVGDAPRPYEPGERPYWLSCEELGRVLDLVQAKSDATDIVLTVDDGNSSDYKIIAPELRKRGLAATFFVLAGKLDQPGYLRRSEVRDLVQAGFEIGSHGLYHVDWVSADDASLVCEVGESKQIIEAVIGRAVTAAAAPFGRYDRRVLLALARSGYHRVFSSDGGPRLTTAWPTPRQTLRTGVDIEALARQIGRRSLHHRARTELRVLVKSSLLGSAIRPSRRRQR
jgi:peptidoglycan/xylan/chitin deacetylase (PgdA/CDA1 family)